MADNMPPANSAQGNASSYMELAIGMSILDAIGGGGEVVGRRNSSFYNNNFDAFGLPRNRFNLIHNIMPQQNTGINIWDQDLRTILGGNAEVHSQPNSAFALAMMGMMASNGIFGLLMGLVVINAQADLERQRQAGATGPAVGPGGQDGPPSIGPAAGTSTGSSTAGRVTSADGSYIDQLGTITVAGEDGEAPAVVAAAGPARAAVSTTRVASATASAEPAAAAGRVVSVPVDRVVPDSIVCEVPKPEAETKKCVLPAKPPRM